MKLATEMGREKEVFEPWSSSRVRRKPGTRGHPTKNTIVGETVAKKKGVSKKPPGQAKGMKRTVVEAITPGTAAELPQQLHNGESSGVRKNQEDGNGAVRGAGDDVQTPTVGVQIHCDSLPTMVTHQSGMIQGF